MSRSIGLLLVTVLLGACAASPSGVSEDTGLPEIEPEHLAVRSASDGGEGRRRLCHSNGGITLIDIPAGEVVSQIRY